MQKRFRIRWLVNLVLLIIVGLLISITLLDKPTPIEPAKQLGHFLPEDITEIRILRPGKNDIHFKLIDGYWTMLSPYQSRAETSLINLILSLSTLEISTLIDNTDIDRANFGLQHPVVTIQLNQQRLNFGDGQAINKRRYVETNNKVMLVPDQHLSQLKAGSISYIDRHLIPQGTKLNGLRIDNKQIDLETPDNVISRWLDAKASWISLAPSTQTQQGIDVYLELDNDQVIHYIAESRESDFVLLSTQQMLEYHLPFVVAESLGLVIAEPDKISDTSQQKNQ